MNETNKMEMMSLEELDAVNGGLPEWLKKATGCIPIIGECARQIMDYADGTNKQWGMGEYVVNTFKGCADLLVVPYAQRVYDNITK